MWPAESRKTIRPFFATQPGFLALDAPSFAIEPRVLVGNYSTAAFLFGILQKDIPFLVWTFTA
jgi:hypothetical protein